MSLLFLLPAGLVALAALLLPALIHLARRSEQRPTVFAALRWLRPKPRPRHRIRFDEWPLLLVRLLLVAVTALLLARPVLHGADDLRPRVAVAPGLDAAAMRASLPGAADAQWLWLAPGLPSVDAVPVAGGSIPSFVRELDAALPPGVPLTIVVPDVLVGVDGERPRLTRRVNWKIVPARTMQPAAVAVPATPRLAVRYAPERAFAARYLQAAAVALNEGGTVDIAPTPGDLPASGALAWLVPGTVPEPLVAWVRRGGVVLLDADADFDDAPEPAALAHDADGRPLAEGAAFGRGRVLRLTRPLTPEAMPGLLDGTFPRLVRGLIAAPVPPPARVSAVDLAPRVGATGFPVQPRELAHLLALLAAALFLVERWLATGRRGRAGV